VLEMMALVFGAWCFLYWVLWLISDKDDDWY
jgi:hypothetical protein